MSLKMKALIAQTDESRSTILYYLKEGLLPLPEKPKQNVHLYDESCVKIIKFIKYLQHNFSYSISEIKNIFNNNHFDFDGSFEMIINSLELISGSKEDKWYSKDEFLEIASIKFKKLKEYQQKGYLFERANGFSSKEVELAEILKRADSLGLDFSLIDDYVSSAKLLALKENKIGSSLLKEDIESHNARYELLFDIILKVKPYIFNMHTVANHKQNITKEAYENSI